MNSIIKNYKHHKILAAIFVCLLMFLGFSLFSSSQAHAAVLLGGIPEDIQLGSTNYAGQGLAPFDTGGPGGCWEGGTRFTQSEWVWLFDQNGPPPNSADDGYSNNPLTVTAGGQLNLGIAAMTFLCNASITPDNTFSSGDNSFTGSNNPEDGTPNTGTGGFAHTYFTPINGWSPGTGYLTEETKFQFDEPSVTSCVNVQTNGGCNGGTTGGVGGNDPMTIEFQDGTRYWYPNGQSLTFNYNAPTTPGQYKIGITLPVHVANHWDIPGGADGQPGPDIYQCVDSPYNFINGFQYGNLESSCSQASTTYFVYVTVTSPNIGGTIYAYDGQGSSPIPSGTVYDCQAGGYTTVINGNYTFTNIKQGTSFCIELVSGVGSTTPLTLPGGESIEISPNNPNGPPPHPPPSCGEPTDHYSNQTAELSGSTGPCSPGNNEQYDIGVTVTATISCTVTANPAVISAGDSTQATVNVTLNPNQWWFRTTDIVQSASGEFTGPATLAFNSMTLVPNSTYIYQQTVGPFNNAGQYNISATITGGPNITAPPSPSCVSNASQGGGLTVQYEPFVRVFGGDVFAGVDSADIASCFDGGANAAVYSFNNNSSNIGTGAGTSVALLDTGGNPPSPLGFSSGQGILGLFDPLTFSNYPNGTQPDYGGGFYTTKQNCGGQPDYYAKVQSLTKTVCPNVINTATFTGMMGITTSGNTVQINPGGSYICYSPSNSTVEIASNITYSLTGGNASDMPVFEVVADNGDINIDNNASTGGNVVSQLAGTYIAEDGNICDSWHTVGGCLVDEPSTSNANNTGSPVNQLTIDGTFIANQLDLYRSYGTVGVDATSRTSPQDPRDAEEFDYSPVNWLAPGSDQAEIESVTSLPPIY